MRGHNCMGVQIFSWIFFKVLLICTEEKSTESSVGESDLHLFGFFKLEILCTGTARMQTNLLTT